MTISSPSLEESSGLGEFHNECLMTCVSRRNTRSSDMQNSLRHLERPGNEHILILCSIFLVYALQSTEIYKQIMLFNIESIIVMNY